MLVASVFFPSCPWADVIHLKSGVRFHVKSWREVGDAIEFSTPGGTGRVSTVDVERIEKEPTSGDVPAHTTSPTPTPSPARPDPSEPAGVETERRSSNIAGGQESQTGSPPASRLARQGYALSREDAEKLEDKLRHAPDDLDTRAYLLGYYFARSLRVSGPAATLEARRRHIFWLIRNRPEVELAGTSEATMDPTGHPLADPEGYLQARALWLKQVEAHKSSVQVMRNAAKFFQLSDKELAERALKRAQALEPKNPEWSASLGYLYALGVMGVNRLNQNGLPTGVNPAEAQGPFAKKAREQLRTSSDAVLITTAASILSQYGSMVYATGLTKQDYGPLAEELLKRAGGSGSGQPNLSFEQAMSLGQHYQLERLRARSAQAKAGFARKELAQWEQARAITGSCG
jgi:hypothetical protein